MANNIDIAAVGGTTKTIQATDNSSVWTPAHQLVRSDGTNPLKILVEDAAHVTADTGILAMIVRADSAACTAGTDGDNCALICDASGKLWVNSQITAHVPGVSATSLGKAEDAAHVTGDTGVFVLAVANATHTTALSGTDGDYTPIGVDTTGKVGIRGTFAEDAAHTTGDLGVQILSVRSDTAAATSGTTGDYQPLITDANGLLHCNVGAITAGTAATSLGKAEDAAHTTGDTGVFVLAVANSTHTAALSGTDGDYTPIAVDTTGKVGVRGTFAEDVAHTNGDLGLFVLAKRTDEAAVSSGTDGDYSSLNVNAEGRLYVFDSITTTNGASGVAVTSADASGTVSVTDAPASGKKLVVKEILVSVGTALTVTFAEETSGSVFCKLYMAANTTQLISFHGKQKLAVADKKLQVTTSASGNISVRASYYSET